MGLLTGAAGLCPARQRPQQLFHLPPGQLRQNIFAAFKGRLSLAETALRQHGGVAKQRPFQRLRVPVLPPQRQQPSGCQRPQLVDASHTVVSMRLAATSVIFSATMALSWPSSWMVFHSQPL